MNVLEEDDQGPLLGERREEPAGRPEDLLALEHAATPIASLKPFRDRPSLLSVGERIAGRELADDLAKRPEGDALPVGDAAADDDDRAVGRPPRRTPARASISRSPPPRGP